MIIDTRLIERNIELCDKYCLFQWPVWDQHSNDLKSNYPMNNGPTRTDPQQRVLKSRWRYCYAIGAKVTVNYLPVPADIEINKF